MTELAPVGPRTVKKYISVVSPLLEDTPNSGALPVFSFDAAARLIKRKNRVYVRAAIIKYVEFMMHEGVLTDADAVQWWNPATGKSRLPSVKEPPAKPKEIPSSHDILRVIGRMEKEDRPVAMFMFYTGCRISEALAVKMKDINFKTGAVTVYGKGRIEKKPRGVKVPVAFATEIEKVAKDLGILGGETVFWPNSKATVMSKVDIFNRRFRVACVEILGHSIGSHDLRRIVATKLLEQTGDIQLVQDILGHEKIETTQRYTKYANKEKNLDRAREVMVQASEG